MSHSENFIKDLKSVKWPVATQGDPKIRFESFMLMINNLLDKHAPFKEQVKSFKIQAPDNQRYFNIY